MKFEIFKFGSVTSTNDVAINLIKEKKKMDGFVYADIQTKGRGTYGKNWISNKGNLFSTIFFVMQKNYPSFNEFSIINAVIISNVIKHFCSKENINLKFPNDIFVNGKKICGLLQEFISLGSKKFLIVGIGLNIQSNPNINNGYKATNIHLETKTRPKMEKVIDLIISSYRNFFVDLGSYSYEDFKKKAQSMALNKVEIQ